MTSLSLRSAASIAFLGALSFSSVRAQPFEPLEREDDPPAPVVWRREFSPQTVVPFGRFTSYQVNVNSFGENIVGDAANEPSITVDPTNPNRMAVGWRQFQQCLLKLPHRRLGLHDERRHGLDLSRFTGTEPFPQ
jgi:hypothetical protein